MKHLTDTGPPGNFSLASAEAQSYNLIQISATDDAALIAA